MPSLNHDKRPTRGSQTKDTAALGIGRKGSRPCRASGSPGAVLQRSPDDGPTSASFAPRLTLGVSSVLQPPEPFSRYHLGLSSLRLELDPDIERRIEWLMAEQLDPTRLHNLVMEGAERVETAPWLPSLTQPPTPSQGTSVRAPSPGPSPPREGTLGDVARALAATEPVARMLENLQESARDHALGVWGHASPGERAMVVSAFAVIGGGTLAGVLSNPSARNRVLPLLNGRPVPIPGVDWLHVELYTGPDSVMFGAHVDLGALLPSEWGFGPGSPHPIGGPPTPEPFAPLQRKKENAPELSAPIAAVVMRALEWSEGRGSALDLGLRHDMEDHLGADLSPVRIHQDARSDTLAQTVGARAFTWGRDIYFRNGLYTPQNSQGRRLLAHELVHVVQHAEGSVAARTLGWNLAVSHPDDPLEIQAEHIAEALDAMSSNETHAIPDKSFSAGNRPVAQNILGEGKPSVVMKDHGRRSSGRAAPAPARIDAQEVLNRDFPHLVSVLSQDQVRQIQRGLDARREVERLERLIDPIRSSILSTDVRRRERLLEQAGRQMAIDRENRFLVIPTDRVLAEDVVGTEAEAPAEVRLYKQRLYRELISFPMILTIPDGYPPQPLLIYRWGPGQWQFPHENGRVRFRDVMSIQRFWLDYERVLVHAQLKTLEEMLELRRQMGGHFHDVRGRVIGEIHGRLWNTTVRVGWEIGELHGYYNDSRGRREMLARLFRLRGARVVLRAPDNWLHIYELDPQVHLRDLTSPNDDGYGYILRRGTQVEVEQILTSDGAWLESTPEGWRHTEYSTGLNPVEEFAVGAIFGDWFEEPSVAATTGQILVGCIPIVGQIADARDVAAGIHKMWQTGGREGKLQTVMALVGFVPLLGDAIKSAFRSGGRRAGAEVFQRAAPEMQSRLSRELMRDSDSVARLFPDITRHRAAAQIAEHAALMRRALGEGSQAAQEYAALVARQLNEMGGNAGAVIVLHGGKWSDVARALARSGDQGVEVMNRMQAWRLRQVELLREEMQNAASELGPGLTGRTIGPPHMQRTGTNAMTSDVDISFLGPDATFYRNYAITVMERRYGSAWRQLLDADIFSDPRRLHFFADLPGRAAREVEQRMVRETELNTLARMLREGTPRETVERYARDAGVPMERVTERLDELRRLSSDPTLRARLELQLDDIHRRFVMETDPARKAALAEEMARIQSRVNAAVEGPYASPGGAARHVTRRENIAHVRLGPFTPLSPAMNYMSFLDDLAMISHVAAEAASRGFTGKTAKDLMKYCDRLLVAAGQNGIDLARIHSARSLFEDAWRILSAARRDPERVAAHLETLIAPARRQLDESIDDLIRAARANAERSLASPVPGVSRASVMEWVERSIRVLHSMKANVARACAIVVRRHVVIPNPPAPEQQPDTSAARQ